MRIYVGNMPFSMTKEDLHELFAARGEVVSAEIVTDRETGRHRGFGFVEMGNESDGMTAIEELNGNEIDGRPLNVNQARPRENRRRDNFGGGGGGFNSQRSRSGYGGNNNRW